MAERAIKTGVYRGVGGSFVARPLEKVNLLYASRGEHLSEPIVSFDHLLAAQVKHAHRRGKHQVTVLDVGSGEAAMYQDVLDHPENMPETVEALRQVRKTGNKDFSIQLLGLTDTAQLLYPPSVDGTVLTGAKGLQLREDVGYPKHAINYAYAITKDQPLKNFLQRNNIESLDLVMASEVLMYFTPRLFSQTLQDIADALSPNGRCIVSGYNHFAGQMLSQSMPTDVSGRRVYPNSLEALQQQAMEFVLARHEDTSPEVIASEQQLQERIFVKWERLARQAFVMFDEFEAGDSPIPDKLWEAHHKLALFYDEYVETSDTEPIAKTMPSLSDFTKKGIPTLVNMLRELKIMYVRREKDTILDTFAAQNPNIQVEKSGRYILSLTKHA